MTLRIARAERIEPEPSGLHRCSDPASHRRPAFLPCAQCGRRANYTWRAPPLELVALPTPRP
eukprot:6214381-Pyramimonas_sp.AAC.1